MLMGERVGRRCQQLHFGVVTEVPTRHGGKRKGAGRKRVLRFEQQPHRSRPWLSSRTPIHIVMRLSKVVGRLRRRRAYHAIRWALIKSLERRNFRVVHISIQGGHIHALCEADDRVALANGVRGLSISAARRLNAAIAADLGLPKARVGQVFIDRYHATQIRSPRQARNALAYVLNNWRKHREDRAAFHAAAAHRPLLVGGVVRRLGRARRRAVLVAEGLRAAAGSETADLAARDEAGNAAARRSCR
jgi:putative transposase